MTWENGQKSERANVPIPIDRRKILIEREKAEVKIESGLKCVKIKRDSRRFCLL